MATSLVNTTALIESKELRVRNALRVLALAFLILISNFALLAWGGQVLIQNRWSEYLKTKDPVMAGLLCLLDGPCRSVLPKAVPIPLWLPTAIAAGLMVVSAAMYVSAVNLRPTKLPGAARFRSSWKEFTHGLSYLGIYEGNALRYPKDTLFRHTMIIGSTGAGKTSRIIRPRLAHTALEGRSAVVLDLKYPDPGLLFMVNVFESYNRNVILYLPYDPRSPSLPFLRGAEDPDIARAVAETIIPVKERSGSTTYYENIERELVFWLVHLEAQKKGSLGNIRYVCQRGHKAVQDFIQTSAQNAEAALGFFFQLADRDKASIVAGLVGKLSVFGDPLLDRATSFGPNEIDISSITRTPTLLYLGIPHDKLQDRGGQLFLQLFKRFLDTVLIEKSKDKGRLEVPVEVFLDEFTNLGYLPKMSDNLSTMRSRGVAYTLALQSFAQGLERYKEEELESIIANCNTWVILPGLGDQDGVRISKALGYASAYRESRGRTEPHFLDFSHPWGSTNERYDLAAVPLLAPEEIGHIPEGKALLRFNIGDPMIVDVPRLDEMEKARGVPKALRAIARQVRSAEAPAHNMGGVSNAFAANYVISKYLSPVSAVSIVPETAFNDPKKQLLDWAEETLLQGGTFRASRDPSSRKINKISIRPPAGLVPRAADEWEKARWVKIEKGRSEIALVGYALEEFMRTREELILFCDVMQRIGQWVEQNGERLEGHPAYKRGVEEPAGRYQGTSVTLHADVLTKEIGLTEDEIKQTARGAARLNNRRNFFEFAMSAMEWYRDKQTALSSPDQQGEA